MNRTMFALTLILFALVITHDRLKSWLLERGVFQSVLIILASIATFVALLARSFEII